MAKTLNGIVVSTGMNNAVVVEITRKLPHPKYKKLLTRSKKFSVLKDGHEVEKGDLVTISEIRPVSKTIYFKIARIVNKKNSEKVTKGK